MTDATSLNYERVRRLRSNVNWKTLVFSLEASRVKAYEREIIKHFELSVLVSGVDRDYLFKNHHHSSLENVVVCTNGVDIHSLPFHYEPHGKSIVFIGNLLSVQNLDAAFFFAEEVLPLLRQSLPDAEFLVVGQIADRARRKLHRIPGVSATGTVTSVREATRHAAAAVCPVRIGAGIQNKILEYMSLGLPTVTTRIGLEGLEARVGVEVLVADSPIEISRALHRLLTSPDFALQLATQARAFVEENHSWEQTLSPIVQEAFRILADKRTL